MNFCIPNGLRFPSVGILTIALVGFVAALPITAQDDGGDAEASTEQADQEPVAEIDFARDIKPILETRCLSCHGPEKQDGDLRVDDPDYMLGNYVFEGDAEGSPLYEYIVSEDPEEMMPPAEEGGPLPAEQIELIRRWIDEGNAEWPDGVTLEAPSEEEAAEAEEAVEAEIAKNDAEKSVGQLLWEICGLLHPLAIHFPIALLMGGAFFAVIGFRGESPLSDAAFYCLWLGALGSALAVASGWSFAVYKGYGAWDSFDWTETMDLHRWGGVGVTVIALVLAIIATISRRRDPYASGLLWKLGLVILAAGAGFVGHQGGKLTHQGLHDRLFDKATIVGDKIFGQGDEPEEEDGAQQDRNRQFETDEDEAADDATGDDSDESSSDDQSGDDQNGDDQSEEGSGDTSEGESDDSTDDDGD